MVTFKSRDTNRAKALRNRATPAERELWKYLNKRQIDGHKFSRQIPIDPYICDFVCREKKLIVEIDGQSHNGSQSYDARRTAFLENKGYHIVRFTNTDISKALEGVVIRISEELEKIPTPSPSRGREGNS